MIYESNGIAGSGKTTLIKKLFAELCPTNSNIEFVGVEKFRGANQKAPYKYMIKIHRFILPLYPRNFIFFLNCMKYFLSKSRGTPLSSNYESYIALLYCVYIYDAYHKKNDTIIVSDEGALQAITAFSLTREGDLRIIFTLLKMIRELDLKKVFICCNLSINEAIKRMSLRDRHDSAIDNLSIVEQKAYLKMYQDRLQLIRAKVDRKLLINIDMTEKNDTLVESIIEFTRRNFK